MARFGPVQSISQTLVIGDPTRSHLGLGLEGMNYIVEDRMVQSFAWNDVHRVDLNLPSTWFRYPGAVAGFAMSTVALLTQDTPDFRAKTGSVHVAHDGGETELKVDTHHLIGYWRGAISATQRLLDRLISDAPSRTLLKDPDALVNTVAASRRWYR